MTGLIFDIKRYAIHDGPGIRTTVFLKGCPLSCDWCQNPESRDASPELMVLTGRCVRCGACVEVCPNVTDESPADEPTYDRATCSRCGACVDACPSGARSMSGRQLSVQEVIAEVARDGLFYDESGGGVTFSGGEPLMQAEFVNSCMEACKHLGFHTALDTCGHGSAEVMLACAEHAELVLYDLKLIDADRHERHVGVSNSLILDNLERLDGLGKRIWVRLPVIPGLNDDEENVAAIADFVRSLRTCPPVQLLPYHRIGSDKYERLGLRYALPEIDPPTPDLLDRIAGQMGASGLKVSIGG